MRITLRRAVDQLPQAGFNLLEIAIVMIVVGLILGGILVGQELIDASKIRRDLATVDRINNEINLFRDRIGSLPGDMPSATSMWTSGGQPEAVQNGNGNGRIDQGTYNDPAFTTYMPFHNTDGESFRVFDHLAAAGIGGYIQYDDTASSVVEVGANMPKFVSPIRLSSWNDTIFDEGYGPIIFSWEGKHYIRIGWATGPGATFDHYGVIGVYRPWDALRIDEKVDDGLPFTGKLTAKGNWIYQWNEPAICNDYTDVAWSNQACCETNADGLDEYNLTDQDNWERNFQSTNDVSASCGLTFEANF